MSEREEPERYVIAFDGTSWYVRRLRVIEHDMTSDEMVYRCDEPLLNRATLARAVTFVQRRMGRADA